MIDRQASRTATFRYLFARAAEAVDPEAAIAAIVSRWPFGIESDRAILAESRLDSASFCLPASLRG